MLPGNIHTDSVWDDLGLDDTAEAGIKRGEIPPLLIVMAAGGQLANYTSGGPWSYESVIMDDLIPYIESTYCAWQEPAGRAIGGMSRGGYWALEIAFRHPDQFASVGGHSAALLDLYGGADVVPQATGLANDLGDLRIYFDIGENDWVIPNVRKLHEDMESAGKAHDWVVNEGRHEDAYWASHTKEYITWYSEPWSIQRDTYPLCMLENRSQSQ
jgi:enterochelin esterase-like enzyme